MFHLVRSASFCHSLWYVSLVGTCPTRPGQMVGRHAPPSAGESSPAVCQKGTLIPTSLLEDLDKAQLGNWIDDMEVLRTRNTQVSRRERSEYVRCIVYSGYWEETQDK